MVYRSICIRMNTDEKLKFIIENGPDNIDVDSIKSRLANDGSGGTGGETIVDILAELWAIGNSTATASAGAGASTSATRDASAGRAATNAKFAEMREICDAYDDEMKTVLAEPQNKKLLKESMTT